MRYPSVLRLVRVPPFIEVSPLSEDPRFCQLGVLRIAYTVQGEPVRGYLVLVHGLAQQLTAWPAALVDALVQAGWRVVCLDNRDVGKSSRMAGRPRLGAIYLRQRFGLTSRAPYLLDDMADDLSGLIEHLAAGPVHLVGVSLGGMLCQIVAARQPTLVASLTSIMSSSGDHRLPGARPDVLRHILNPPRRPSFKEAVAHDVRIWELIGSPGYPTPRAALVERVEQALERGHPDAGGADRQLAGILASGSRVPLLAHIGAPTLVIHGDADPLVPLAAGRHVQAHTPGACLEVIAGMGHDLPDALLPRIARLITQHTERARAAAGPVPAEPAAGNLRITTPWTARAAAAVIGAHA
jgi:pimeloyl-ACP methyl ester carboxylesterase